LSAPKYRFYFAGLVAAALAVFALPIPFEYYPSFKDSNLRRTLKPGSDTVIFGASTIDGKSHCDTDRRSIAAMASQSLGKTIINASYTGQAFEDSVQFAALAAKAPGIKTVVLTSIWGGLGEDRLLSLHNYVVFRELNPELKVAGPFHYFQKLSDLKGASAKVEQAFSFRGERYQGLDSFNRTLFVKESAARTCPENDGQDQKAIAAVYYRRLMADDASPANLALISSLNQAMARKGKSLVMVMLPINVDRLAQIDPTWPTVLRDRRARWIGQLQAQGVRVVDLSETLPNGRFIDRWCGCAHYSQEGRKQVAEDLAKVLKARPTQTAMLDAPGRFVVAGRP
jgi:hypothetical protein